MLLDYMISFCSLYNYYLRLCIRFATNLSKRKPKKVSGLGMHMAPPWLFVRISCVFLWPLECQLYTLSWACKDDLMYANTIYHKHKYIRIINYLMSKFLSVFPSNWRFLAGNGTTWWLSTVSASELGTWWSKVLLNYYSKN